MPHYLTLIIITQNMNKNWSIIEKSIGGFQIIYSISMIIVSFYIFSSYTDFITSNSNSSLYQTSLIKILLNYHQIALILVLGIFAGLALILNKMTGYLMSLVFSMITGSGILLSMLLPDSDIDILSAKIFRFLFVLSFLIIFTLLASKPFRFKYKTTNKTWWFIFLIIILVQVYRFVLKDLLVV